MKINEKRVARPPKAAKLEIHFEGNLICCKWAKNILLHSARGCTVCPSAASVCRHVFVADEERYALNSSAERGETQEPVNNSSNSILFLHDCSPALASCTSKYNSRMWKRTCQKLLARNKVWPAHICPSVCVRACKHVRRCMHGFVFALPGRYESLIESADSMAKLIM